MASTLKHLRSSTSDKRPTASGLADGQLAINTASGTPALFFKDNHGTVVKVGPAHVGAAAPNAVPAGSAGNSLGELWVNNGLTTAGLNYYTGSGFVNLTPSGTETTIGLVELATAAETQTGTDAVRVVTPSGLQSKVSDSTSTTSSTTIASSTAVKTAYDLAHGALPKTGGIITGALEIGTTGSLVFEGSSNDSFDTTIAVVNPTASRVFTLPNISGTAITNADTGTVTSTMIANDTIVNADINSAAAIAYSKLALSSGIVNTDINASAAIAYGKLALSGGIVNTDISASAEIAVSKLADGAARQLLQTDAAGTGVEWASNIDIPGTLDVTSAATFDSTVSIPLGAAATPSLYFGADSNTGIYSPGADQVAISTNGTGRLFVDSAGRLSLGTSTLPAVEPHSNITAGANLPTFRSLHADQQYGIAFCSDSDTTAGYGSALSLARTRSSTLGGFTIVQNGDTLGTISFAGADGSDIRTKAATIFGAVDGTPNANDMPGRLVFSTTPSGAALPVERMRLDSSGRLGLGTSSPAARFHISDLTATDVELMRLQVNLTSPSGNKSITWADSTNVVGRISLDYTSPAAKMRFGSLFNSGYQTSDLMTLTPTGLGIGTTSPGATLHVEGSELRVKNGTGVPNVTLSGRDSDGTAVLAFQNNGSSANNAALTATTNTLAIATAGSERARIDSSGRLLVGTSTAFGQAGFTFAPNYSQGSASVVFNRANTTNNSVAAYFQDNSTNVGSLQYSNNTFGIYGANGSSVVFGQNTFEVARIDSSGRFLVGTSTSTNSIRLGQNIASVATGGGSNYGGTSVTSYSGTFDSARPILDIQRSRGTTDGSFTAVASGDWLGTISWRGADGSQWVSCAAIDCQVDGTPGANDMPGRLVFSTTADGASSPTEALRITSDKYLRMAASTGGIQFNGDTAAANALDDYEEGTWTPDIANGYNSGATVSYTSRVGSYTKIGRLVTVAFELVVNTISGGGGPIFFGGLPFTPASTTDARFQGAVYFSGVNTPASSVSCNLGYAKLDNGSYYLTFNCIRDDIAMANAGCIQHGDVLAGDTVAGTFTYFV